MQQRQPRLGDIVDDYCPRERRVTNHAVVAMVGDEVKQTRCTTCDAEHEYKQARVPAQRRKKDAQGALYQQVLDGLPRVVPPTAESSADDEPAETAAAEPEPETEPEPVAVGAGSPVEHEGPVHRRLIRATLPRLPGAEAPTRREPEFTIRNPGQRPAKPKGNFRGFRAGSGGSQGQGGSRGGRRQSDPQGGGWNRSGQPGGNRGPGGQRQGRNKKRSR